MSKRLGLDSFESDATRLATMMAGVFGHPVFLDAPLTSTAWDGDAYSTTAKTKIDLSSVFSAPAGIKGVLVSVAIRDSGSNGTDCWFLLSPNDTAAKGLSTDCHTINNRYSRASWLVPCDSNGDIYYQNNASGADTMDVVLEIWGYVL